MIIIKYLGKDINMFENGAIVTLIERKSHGEGDDAMTLSSGVCGMVVQIKKKALDKNHEYVVDFGPYGQWYCYHGELRGQEPVREEGYDLDDEPHDIIERLLQPPARSVEHNPDDEEVFVPVDFEADLKKRMKEIENGSY
jgi:hypothetical protein